MLDTYEFNLIRNLFVVRYKLSEHRFKFILQGIDSRDFCKRWMWMLRMTEKRFKKFIRKIRRKTVGGKKLVNCNLFFHQIKGWKEEHGWDEERDERNERDERVERDENEVVNDEYFSDFYPEANAKIDDWDSDWNSD